MLRHRLLRGRAVERMGQPHIAILGAGPIGLDAALCALDEGFTVTLYEAAAHVAGNVRRWGHVRLFTPWEMNLSQRMRQHLAALGVTLPERGAILTGAEFCDLALEPLARLPQLAPCLRLGTRVIEIGREGVPAPEALASPVHARRPFRLRVSDEREEGEAAAAARERIERADLVIDATGLFGHPNTLGDGGIPAPGERALGGRIDRFLPDFERDAGAWGGRAILLAGAGHSAQTAACALARLAAEHPGTRVFWVLRSPNPDFGVRADDPLPERSALAARARDLVAFASDALVPYTGSVVQGLAEKGSRIEVTLRRTTGEERLEVDRVLSLTGGVGDFRLYRELDMHESDASAAPLAVPPALVDDGAGDGPESAGPGGRAIMNPEPNFFVLGAKSYGRGATFLLRTGYAQVDELFAELSGVAAI